MVTKFFKGKKQQQYKQKAQISVGVRKKKTVVSVRQTEAGSGESFMEGRVEKRERQEVTLGVKVQ